MRLFKPSLSLTHKDDIQLLVPLWHIQVAQASLLNISSPAIKPHFAAFHTIVSDECRMEPSLCSASALWLLPNDDRVAFQTVSSFWCPPSLHSLAVWWRKDHLNMSLRAGLEMLAIYFRVFNLILSWELDGCNQPGFLSCGDLRKQKGKVSPNPPRTDFYKLIKKVQIQALVLQT